MLLNVANSIDPGAEGFKIMLMPDMEVFKYEPERLKPMIKELSNYPAVYRLTDNRLVVSPYNAQNLTPEWWADWLAEMRKEGIDIAFVPLFQGWERYASQFKSISYGMSDWGWASPKAQINGNWGNVPKQAHNYAEVWMMPVRPQDMRPASGVYSEAGNGELYRVMWENAIKGDADWVQLITWNDYSEHACMAPSTGTQYSFYDLTAYYLTWFKTGVQPAITRDALYYFHRRHSTTEQPSVQPNKLQVAPGSDTPQNVVEVMAFLTAPGTLEIQTKVSRQTKEVPAGVTSFQVPLKPGKPIFRLYRNNQKILVLPSIFEIKGSIKYQDLLYYGGSNTRKQELYPELLYKID
jgi:hypothetical protein